MYIYFKDISFFLLLRAADSIKICWKEDDPSIPSPGQGFEYEEGEDGTLIKQYPPQRHNAGLHSDTICKLLLMTPTSLKVKQ